MNNQKTNKKRLLGTLVNATEEAQQKWLIKALNGPEAEVAEEVLQGYLTGKTLSQAIIEIAGTDGFYETVGKGEK